MVAFQKYASCIPLRRVSDVTGGSHAVAPASDRHQTRLAALADADLALAAVEDDIVRQDYMILQLERTGENTAFARARLAALQARHALARDRRARLVAG